MIPSNCLNNADTILSQVNVFLSEVERNGQSLKVLAVPADKRLPTPELKNKSNFSLDFQTTQNWLDVRDPTHDPLTRTQPRSPPSIPSSHPCVRPS